MHTHYPWLIRITAVEAYRGNPDDPLVWHFLSTAETATQAISETRQGLGLPESIEIRAIPR